MTAATATLPLIDTAAEEARRLLGMLSVGRAEGRAPLPLAAVEIAARVADRIAEVTLTQTFHNPYREHLEAVYVFPLAGGAAVSDFELRVGERVLRGIVRERGAARADYRRALAEGRRAALLEQERDDVFTLQVGNLPPGEAVTVRLTYAERLPFFEDGTTELRLPLVVAPRYVPGEPLDREVNEGRGSELDTDVVPDASRVTPPRLVPGFDPRVALRIAVELLRGGDGEGWRTLGCSQHAVLSESDASRVTVSLAREDEPLDRDFVLRWSLVGERVRSTLLVHRGAGGEAGYGMLALVPPARQEALELPRDVVFLLDRSGSMEGVKMVSAARACAVLLRTLGPRDRFALQAFDDRVEWMPGGADGEQGDGARRAHWAAADEGALERADRWLREVGSRGGTELDQALGAALAALDERPATDGRAALLVLLTDGQVTDEHRVLRRVQRQLGDGRVFTVGVDTAVNEAFLRRLAALGGGTASFVQPGAAVERALVELGREIGAPLVVDLAIEDAGAGMERGSVTPARLPDLFAGRAVGVGLRLAAASAAGAAAAGRLRVTGRSVDGQAFADEVEAREVALPALAQLWARSRVRDLEDEYRLADARGRARIERQIVDLAVRHRLLTRFSAFVVVDEQEVVNPGGELRSVVQPVATPAGWEMGKAAASAGAAGAAMPFAAMSFAPATQPSAPARPPARVTPPLEVSEDDLFLDSDAGDWDEPVGAVDEDDDTTGSGEVAAALTALERALEGAAGELVAGRLPAAAPLSVAREALLDALAEWSHGDRVPALQRFLRADLPELLAALARSSSTPAALHAVLERHRETFAAAKREADDVLGAGGGARWGLTV